MCMPSVRAINQLFESLFDCFCLFFSRNEYTERSTGGKGLFCPIVTSWVTPFREGVAASFMAELAVERIAISSFKKFGCLADTHRTFGTLAFSWDDTPQWRLRSLYQSSACFRKDLPSNRKQSHFQK